MTLPMCMMAKPPVPGRVKTRLGASVGMDVSARLARAFLRDTWHIIGQTPGLSAVLATTDVEHAQFPDELRPRWDQGSGDLGARMERVLRRALKQAPGAFVVGADSPGIPRSLLQAARVGLEGGEAVVGPASDGGFYLLGLRRCPEGMLADLPWSQPHTFEATIERLEAHGLVVTVLEPWFDVDTLSDLARLRDALRTGQVQAPHTLAVLNTLG